MKRLIAGVALVATLAACGGTPAPSLPQAQGAGQTSNGEIEVWDDPQRDVVCYAWDGYETDGFSCVHLPAE